MLSKPDNADCDEVNRDDIVENSGHQQNENTRDQCNQWIQKYRIHSSLSDLPQLGAIARRPVREA